MTRRIRGRIGLGLTALALVACGDRSGQLSPEEFALYEAALRDQQREAVNQTEVAGPVTSDDMQIFLADFFAYEEHLSQLIELRAGLDEAELAERLGILRDERRELMRRKRRLFEPPRKPSTGVKNYDHQTLTLALLNAASTSGPVKTYLDDNIDLKEELTELIVSSRTMDPEGFRARALAVLDDIEASIDDPAALETIMNGP